MSEDVIARGVIQVTADATQLKAGVEDAKKSIRTLGDASKQASAEFAKTGDGGAAAAKKVDNATKNMIGSIQRTIAVMEAGSRSNSKYFETLAQQRGINTDALKPFLAQLDAVAAKQGIAGAATDATNKAFGGATKTAKELQFALRGVPAQFTDIATSLASGQRPLQVFLQQGGQLKDMFGGLGPAARALGGYVLGLINPFTVAAAATVTLGVAWNKGAEESIAFNKALILTGGYAGMTADQMQSLSKSMGDTISSQHAVAEAMAQVAATGKFSGSQIGLVTAAVEQMRIATGRAAKETIAEFALIAEDPVKGLIKLNEQYHFLTASTYAQVKALQDQGREQEAQTLGIATYSNEMQRRSEDVVKSLGLIEKGWNGVKEGASKAWSAMLNIGRDSTLEDEQKRLAELQKSFAAARPTGPFQKSGAVFQERIQKLIEESQARINKLKEDEVETEKRLQSVRANEGFIDLSQEADKYLTREQQRAKEIVEAHNKANKSIEDAVKAGDTELVAKIKDAEARLVAGINKKFENKETPKEQKSLLSFDLSAIKQAADAQIKIYTDAERIIQARRSAGLLDEQSFYTQKIELIQAVGREQEQAAQKEIDRMREENLTGKEKIDNEKKIAEAIARMATIRADTSAKATIASIEQQAALKKLVDAYQNAKAAAQDYLDTISRSNDRDLASMGKGGRQREIDDRKDRRDDQFLNQRNDLERDRRTGQITEEQYQQQLQIAKDTYDQALELDVQYWDRRLANQADWSLGMSEAWANYLDEARDIAGQTQQIFSTAFDGMEEGISSLVRTGKADLNSLLNTLIDMSIKMALRWAVMEATKTTATVSGTATRSAIELTAAAQSQAVTAETASGNILSKAWESAANVYAEVAKLPYVGWILAPTMAIAAAAAVGSYVSRIASARGGYDIPAGVNPMTQLHEQEMVLPKEHANTIRRLGEQDSSAPQEIHIHAVDGRSVERMLKKNGGAVAQTLRREARKFADV